MQQTTAQCQRNCCALENIMYDKCSKRCNYGRRKKRKTHFSPFSTPAICYCGCSASCAYIFFSSIALVLFFSSLSNLKRNTIQFNSAIIHTQSNLLHGFFSRLDCYLLFHFVCYSQAFTGRTASVFECVCMGRTLLLCIIDKFRMFVRGIFFWVRTVFHCYWFGVVGCYRCRCYIAAIRADGRRSIELFVVCILYILKYKHI